MRRQRRPWYSAAVRSPRGTWPGRPGVMRRGGADHAGWRSGRAVPFDPGDGPSPLPRDEASATLVTFDAAVRALLGLYFICSRHDGGLSGNGSPADVRDELPTAAEPPLVRECPAGRDARVASEGARCPMAGPACGRATPLRGVLRPAARLAPGKLAPRAGRLVRPRRLHRGRGRADARGQRVAGERREHPRPHQPGDPRLLGRLPRGLPRARARRVRRGRAVAARRRAVRRGRGVRRDGHPPRAGGPAACDVRQSLRRGSGRGVHPIPGERVRDPALRLAGHRPLEPAGCRGGAPADREPGDAARARSVDAGAAGLVQLRLR